MRAIPVVLAAAVVVAGCATTRPAGVEVPVPAVASTAAALPVAVALRVPDAAWKVEILEVVRATGGEVWVLAGATREEGPAASVVTTVRDAAEVDPEGASTAVVKVFLVGRTWAWAPGKEVVEVESVARWRELTAGFAPLRFRRVEPAAEPEASPASH